MAVKDIDGDKWPLVIGISGAEANIDEEDIRNDYQVVYGVPEPVAQYGACYHVADDCDHEEARDFADPVRENLDDVKDEA